MTQRVPRQYGTGTSSGQGSGVGYQSGQSGTGLQGPTGQERQYAQGGGQSVGSVPGPQGTAGVTGVGGAQVQGPQTQDLKLEEAITDEMRVALHDFAESARVCEWCADQCIDEGPGMAECIRLCRDVAEIATLNVKLVSRDSVFGPELAAVFTNVAEACARECAQHPHRHCQECAEVLQRAVQSTRKMLASFGTGTPGASGVQGQNVQGGDIQQRGVQSGTMQSPTIGTGPGTGGQF